MAIYEQRSGLHNKGQEKKTKLFMEDKVMLTRTETKTLAFIKSFIEENDYSPTIAEIAKALNFASRGTTHRYVQSLKDKGYIRITPHKHRNIEMVGQAINDSEIPLLGRIAAGQPIEAIPDRQAVNLSSIFLKENRYALEVKGDSMIEEGIMDGDIVVCEHKEQANNGQIVVALIDDNEATLKRFKRNTDNSITLIPANPDLSPMTYEASRVKIQGIYVGLLRFLAT